jgi:uncharacterized glyoxalase superfamily protein PhnB
MNQNAQSTRCTVVPCMVYRDAAKAIDWLCDTFGFEKQAVYPDQQGLIMHAQLTFGNGMIMLGSKMPAERDTPFGKLIKQPDEIGGCETQSAYIVVADADIIYQRAKAAGAEILIDIKNEDYGGRGFTCRDLEGHIWNIGTYDPWRTEGGAS